MDWFLYDRAFVMKELKVSLKLSLEVTENAK